MPERKEIMIEEMGALSKNIHGNLFQETVGFKWVFTVKQKDDGTV